MIPDPNRIAPINLKRVLHRTRAAVWRVLEINGADGVIPKAAKIGNRWCLADALLRSRRQWPQKRSNKTRANARIADGAVLRGAFH